MDRLAKKCLIASSVLHGTLVLVLLVGPAFLPSEKPLEAKQIIDFIPFKTIEASMSGGGNPNVEQVIPVTPPKPDPAPPQPRREEPPKREEPKPKEPVKPEPKSDPKPEPKVEDTGWKPNAKIKVNLDQTTRGTPTTKTPTTTRRDNEAAKALESAARNISSKASAPVQLQDFKGPGGGGIPYAGFNDALISAYMRAWLIPSEAADETSKVVVTIVMRRDGTVISSRIQRRSGNSSLDASVQRALDKVNFVAPFPDSVKDTQKTFWLEFDPRAKRMMG